MSREASSRNPLDPVVLQGSAVPSGRLAAHGTQQRQHHLADYPSQWPGGPENAGRLWLHASREADSHLMSCLSLAVSCVCSALDSAFNCIESYALLQLCFIVVSVVVFFFFVFGLKCLEDILQSWTLLLGSIRNLLFFCTEYFHKVIAALIVPLWWKDNAAVLSGGDVIFFISFV